MIRHEIALAEIYDRIEKEKPGWKTRADALIEKNAKARNPKFPAIWSEIKQVYLELQGSKCAFCEKWLEDKKIEHDVEHFRPKGTVKRCELPPSIQSAGAILRQPASGDEPGYQRLAYHPLNYVTACMTCNRILKRSYFPIADPRAADAGDPAACVTERPYLIYPISDIDEDPEELIEFDVLSPEARVSKGFRRCRALVTIWMFRLDDWRRRKELNKDRFALLPLRARTSSLEAPRIGGQAQASEGSPFKTREIPLHSNDFRRSFDCPNDVIISIKGNASELPTGCPDPVTPKPRATRSPLTSCDNRAPSVASSDYSKPCRNINAHKDMERHPLCTPIPVREFRLFQTLSQRQ